MEASSFQRSPKSVLTQDSVTHQKHLDVRVTNELNLLKNGSNRYVWQHTGLTSSTDRSERSHRDLTRNLQTSTREGSHQDEHAESSIITHRGDEGRT
jgi:hypothetical protein